VTCRAKARALSGALSAPASSNVPDAAGCSRASERSTVDLPDPLGPIRAVTTPDSRATETPCTTVLRGYPSTSSRPASAVLMELG
jgi:hypothetical protein